MRSTWVSRYKPGQPAPVFEARLQDDRILRSSDLKGKKYILFFYNHDGSETCTKQACNVRDEYARLTKKGYRVFGASEDSAKKHLKFIEKYKLPYPLIVDTDNALAKAFDIYGKKEFMGRTSDAVHRTTFVVNEQGLIDAVIHPVDAARHGQQILDTLSAPST